MREPCSWKKVTSFSTSVMAGTFCSVTGSSVRSDAQRIGRTEFLLPEGVMVPVSGLPPVTTRSAIEGKRNGARARVEDFRFSIGDFRFRKIRALNRKSRIQNQK